MKDQLSGLHSLVDSGADESVFPARGTDFNLPRSSDLVAANGLPIKTFGKRSLPVEFGGRRFLQEFWIATLSRPILGADFFHDHAILIDVGNKRLVSSTGESFQAQATRCPLTISGLRLPTSGPLESLLEEFPDLLV